MFLAAAAAAVVVGKYPRVEHAYARLQGSTKTKKGTARGLDCYLQL